MAPAVPDSVEETEEEMSMSHRWLGHLAWACESIGFGIDLSFPARRKNVLSRSSYWKGAASARPASVEVDKDQSTASCRLLLYNVDADLEMQFR